MSAKRKISYVGLCKNALLDNANALPSGTRTYEQ